MKCSTSEIPHLQILNTTFFTFIFLIITLKYANTHTDNFQNQNGEAIELLILNQQIQQFTIQLMPVPVFIIHISAAGVHDAKASGKLP